MEVVAVNDPFIDADYAKVSLLACRTVSAAVNHV